MVYRTRGPRRIQVGGSAVQGSTTTNQNNTYYSGKDWVDSVTSPGPPYTKHNNFDLVKSDGQPGRFTGQHNTLNLRYNNWAVATGLVWSSTVIGGITLKSDPGDWQRWLNRALSSVDFSRPVVALPAFLWELKEFPSMLMDLGRVLGGGSRASDIPGAYLAWQFGWAPLFSDLAKLIYLGEQIELSQKHFLKAKARKKLGGTLIRDQRRSLVENPINVLTSANLHREWELTEDAWWTAHWDLIDGYPEFLFGSIASQYVNALALNRPLYNIWEAMPWSWLIDYFTDVGTFLEVSGGVAEYQPATVCIMRRTHETVLRDEIVTSSYKPGYDWRPTEWTSTRKERHVYPDPMARPVFDVFGFVSHLDILASLVTVRALRSIKK